MNKKYIDQMIPVAYEKLESCKIAENGIINKAFRGQISSFGAAMTTGSLLATVAFFQNQGSAVVHREYLNKAIFEMIKQVEGTGSSNNLYEYVQQNNSIETKEKIVDCAIAIKLAMNLYGFKEA